MILLFVILACLASIASGQLYIAPAAIIAGLLMGMGGSAHDRALESIPDDANMIEAESRAGCGFAVCVLFGLAAVAAFVLVAGLLSRMEGL